MDNSSEQKYFSLLQKSSVAAHGPCGDPGMTTWWEVIECNSQTLEGLQKRPCRDVFCPKTFRFHQDGHRHLDMPHQWCSEHSSPPKDMDRVSRETHEMG